MTQAHGAVAHYVAELSGDHEGVDAAALTVALTLGAIVPPTDPLAATAIASRLQRDLDLQHAVLHPNRGGGQRVRDR